MCKYKVDDNYKGILKMEECPETSRTNPVKAIRLKCLDCSGGSSAEVEKCDLKKCALWPFRFGKNPFRTKRELSDIELHFSFSASDKGRSSAFNTLFAMGIVTSPSLISSSLPCGVVKRHLQPHFSQR